MRFLQRPWSKRLGVEIGMLALLTSASRAVLSRAGEGTTDPKIQAAREQFFEQSVRPLLAENCYSCHGDQKQKGGLRLDSLEAILKGGDSGPAIVPGKPEESLLIAAINFEGPEMPPTGKLAPENVAALTRWVALGAPWPPRDRAAAHATTSLARTRALTGPRIADRALWSLQPLRRPAIPEVGPTAPFSGAEWSSNPVDRFILKGLLDHGLTLAPEADRATL